MIRICLGRVVKRLFFISVIIGALTTHSQLHSQLLINVDFGGGSATAEVGPAATGHAANDFWNYYSRNGPNGEWLTFGVLSGLQTAEGVPTTAGLIIVNAPGAWGNGSADDMYNSYDYPFDGGNVNVAVSSLETGAYDFFVYGIDSTYEIQIGSTSYGKKSLPSGPVDNPVVWQEGLQYVLFPSVPVIEGDTVILTVRPGSGGYATISGMQIAGTSGSNHPPAALTQSVVLAQDTTKAITLTGSDLDRDPLTFTIATPPAHGTLSGTAPSVTYIPDAEYSGPDSFSFTVNDGQVDSTPGTVSVKVLATNIPTLINLDIGGGLSAGKVGPAATGHSADDFWNYYTRNGAGGLWLTFGFVTDLKTAEGLPTGAGFTIANAPGAWGNGSDDDMYHTYDYPFDGGNVTMTVTNLEPGAYDFYLYGIDSRYEISVNGHNYGSKPLPNGPVVNPVVWQEGLQYVQFRSVRVDSEAVVTITSRPGAGGFATISGLQIAAVTPTNHVPVVNSQTLIVPHNGTRSVTLTGYDVDDDVLTYTVVTQPAHGTLTGSPPTLTYTPTADYSGSDSFSYSANDGQVDSDAATVNLAVLPSQQYLLINIDVGAGSSTSAVGPAATGHAASDFWNFYSRDDRFGNWLSFGYLENLSSAEGLSTGAGFTIANAPGAWGNGSSDSMYYSYNYPFDGGNVVMTVTNLQADAYDFYVYGFDSTYEITVDGQSYGAKPLLLGPILNPVVWQEGLQYVLFQSVEVQEGASVTITVRPGADGNAIISGLQISGTSPGNHPPVARNQNVFAPQEGTEPIVLTGSDLDADALMFSIATFPTNGTLSGEPPNVTYAPVPGYSGPDSFTFTVSDGQFDSAPATVSINVFAASPDRLIGVDFGSGSSTTEVGPAATGHTATDFWNFYSRDGSGGQWLTFGFLTNLSTVTGAPTTTGLTIANAPGCWGLGSGDVMYHTYVYPFDGGNVTINVTNLASGAYDFFLYGINSGYEVRVGDLSYGIKSLPNSPGLNTLIWQEGLQYVLCRSVQVTNDDIVTITVRPGKEGPAAISGLQIALIPPVEAPHPVALLVPAVFAPTSATLRAGGITSTGAVLNASVNPRGVPTTAWFEWGPTPAYGNVTPAQMLSAGGSNITASATLTGLTAGQTYYFRARSSNLVDESDGAQLSFVWNSAQPVITAINANNFLPLRFTGAPGQTYQVEMSSDLVHWSTLGTAIEKGSGSFEFQDAASAGQAARFYRLRAP